VGGSDTDVAAVYGEGVSGVFPINPLPQPFSEVRAHCRENLRFTAENLMRFYRAVRR
jgi:glycerate kinase